MSFEVHIETAKPRILAAVSRKLRPVDVSSSFKPALDTVWSFLATRPGLRSGGHNVFLYDQRCGDPETGMHIHFGVEVSRRFEDTPEISCISTPGGKVAVAVHRGPYRDIPAAHAALLEWFQANNHEIGLWSWEIYGDPKEDESQLETMIAYTIAAASQPQRSA